MSEQIEITPTLQIDGRTISYEFVRASGPGGQHVNKVSTAVQLRFDINNSGLPGDVRDRLKERAATRINSRDELIIQSRQSRSQFKNRQHALDRLISLLQEVAVSPKTHKPRRGLSRAAKQRRLEAKRKRSEIKQARRRITW